MALLTISLSLLVGSALAIPSPQKYEGHGGSAGGCGYAGGGPTATIDSGVVIGTATSLPAASASVNKFLGVPFAQSPPVRFAPPEPVGASSEPIIAQEWAPACIQQFRYPRASYEFTRAVFNTPAPEESEDCLYLNVYAPSTPAPADGRAVLFWIYGGSLQFGTAGQSAYDGSSFASYEDVIVVTTNYRTNVFGFPSSPELPDDGHNLGFLDQRAALEWVQSNIAAFGGSPDKVTIFGESAGAFSIDALLTSYPAGSNPPFRGAILQSGQLSYRDYSRTTDSVEAWNNLTTALDCPGDFESNLACVRAAPAATIRRIIDRGPLVFNPTPDGVTLVADPAAQRESGNIAAVPILAGTDAQEGRVFNVGQNDTDAFLEATFVAYPDLIPAIKAAYPLGQDGLETDYDQISQIYTEAFFQCGQAKQVNATAAIGIPAWRYYFNASFVNTQGYPGLGVYHSSEISIVFGTYPTENTTTQEYALSKSMQGAWARFARNPASGPGWNQKGSGAPGIVLVGAVDSTAGGNYMDGSGNVVSGAWDLGLFGNRYDSLGSGVTVVDEYELDYRCPLFDPIYSGGAGS